MKQDIFLNYLPFSQHKAGLCFDYDILISYIKKNHDILKRIKQLLFRFIEVKELKCFIFQCYVK